MDPTRQQTQRQYILAPASESDMPRLMSIMFAAFDQEPYHETVENVRVPSFQSTAAWASGSGPAASWPPADQYENEVQAATGNRYLEAWRKDPNQEIIMCIDPSSTQILGWAKWVVHARWREEKEWNAPLPPYPQHAAPLSEKEQRAIVAFTQKAERKRRQLRGGRPYVFLGNLTVDPEYHRRGVGRTLLEWGFRKTEALKARLREEGQTELADDVVVYLEATDMGMLLYTKMGFERVDQTIIEPEEWDGGRQVVYPVMVWRP